MKASRHKWRDRIAAAFVALIVCLLVIAGCGPNDRSSAPANTAPISYATRHIVVLYDASASMLVDRPAAAHAAGVRVIDLLFGSDPLWRAGDCLSVYRFGMQHDAIDAMAHEGHDNLWPKFQSALIHEAALHAECAADNTQIRQEVEQALSGGVVGDYSLSSFAGAATLSRLSNLFADEMLVVWVSDLAPGAASAREIDGPLIRTRTGVNSGPLLSITDAFNTSEWVTRESLVIQPGGVRVAVLQARTPQVPLFVLRGAARAEEKNGGWEIHLPPVRMEGAAGGLHLVGARMALSGTAGPIGEKDLSTDQSRMTSTNGQEFPVIELAGNRLLLVDKTPMVEIRFALRRDYPDLRANLPIVARARAAVVQVVPLPPFWERVAWPAAGALTLLFLFWFTFFSRSPVFCVEEPKVLRDGRIQWRQGLLVNAPLVVRNTSSAFNLRRAHISARLTQIPMDIECPLNVALRVREREYGVGKVAWLKPLRSREQDKIDIVLDFGGSPEPQSPRPPGNIEIELRCGRESRILSFSVVVIPDPGNFWIGIDPGTTGACIAGGTDPGDIGTVPLTQEEGEDRFVAPSLVFICRNATDAAQPGVLTCDLAGQPVSFLAGSNARSFTTLPNVERQVFRSAKRLIGYNNVFPVPFGSTQRHIHGSDAVTMLTQYLLDAAKREYAIRMASPPRINKAVIAVPNTFTPVKIQEMRSCCERNGLRTEHIYEAEAVIMFYIWKTRSLVGPDAEDVAKLREDGENIFVFDFGGGSANFTSAHIKKSGDDINVIVQQRLGLSLGGDHLDFAIAQLLWRENRNDPAFGGLDPTATSDSPPLIKLRNSLLESARELKHKCTKMASSGDRDRSITLSDPRLKTRLTVEALLASPELSCLLAEVEQGVRELTGLCKQARTWKGVDTLIFTGRSTRFPDVKERIQRTTEELNNGEIRTINLDEHQAVKTCVAEGAVFYATQRAHVFLDRRPQAFAYYGVHRYASADGATVEFLPLIGPGQYFKEGVCRGRLSSRQFPYNAGMVRLYQLMGSDPTEMLRDGQYRHTRATTLAEFAIHAEVDVDAISLDLQLDDNFSAVLGQGDEVQRRRGAFLIEDVRAEGDPSTEWLLAGRSGARASGGNT